MTLIDWLVLAAALCFAVAYIGQGRELKNARRALDDASRAMTRWSDWLTAHEHHDVAIAKAVRLHWTLRHRDQVMTDPLLEAMAASVELDARSST